MSILEERPIHRVRNPVFNMSLSIYPVSVCGKDLQKGKPIVVSATSEDLYSLKCRTHGLIMSVIHQDEECFVEMVVTKDGRYYDSDEWWCVVDHEKKEVFVGGHYEV